MSDIQIKLSPEAVSSRTCQSVKTAKADFKALRARLLSRLEGKDGAVIAENAAEVLAAIARARTPPLTYVLGSPDNIRRLLDLCTKQDRKETKTQLLVQVRLVASF